MPFDGGFSGGSAQVTALQDFNAQLVSTFGWSSSQAYAHEGFSGMNGRSDSAEYLYQCDFQTVLSFAESSGMSRFTFWSVNRDRECNPPDNGYTSSECSSVTQNPVGLHRLHGGLRGNAPVSTATPSTSSPTPTPTISSPTPIPTPTPTTSSAGCSAAAWVSSQAYVSASVVSYGGDKWTANQWNYDEAPGGPSGAWNNDGPC